MTKDRNQFRDDLTDDDGAGWINRFLAEEDEFDGRAMWRLASWGIGSVGVLIIAILATRSPAAINRDQLASAELTRQSQQVQWIAKESQSKARELAAAVETLNTDRDRLYTRVTMLEQGLDSVTGSLARQPAPVPPSPVALKALQPAEHPQAALASPADLDPVGPFKPAEAQPESAAPPPKIAAVTTAVPATTPTPAKRDEPKANTPAIDQTSAPAVTSAIAAAVAPPDAVAGDMPSASVVRRTEFGIDLGGANSVEGLRSIWRSALKTSAEKLASLQPIIVVKERHDGLGMQLRLVAGPLSDAAEAAKVCAGLLTGSNRPCETSVYDGQRLSLTSEKKHEAPAQRSKRRSKERSEAVEEKPRTSSLSSFFGMK
jgi:hypothetical protein